MTYCLKVSREQLKNGVTINSEHNMIYVSFCPFYFKCFGVVCILASKKVICLFELAMFIKCECYILYTHTHWRYLIECRVTNPFNICEFYGYKPL